MKKLIYVLLPVCMAVSCKQADKKATKTDDLHETADQQKALIGFKWNKCEDMEEILKDIQDGRLIHEHEQEGVKHRTNQGHMHVENFKLWEYNGKIRSGNVTF